MKNYKKNKKILEKSFNYTQKWNMMLVELD